MALTSVQRRILASLAPNRSERSYVAGGLVLNKDWPRRSDDMDVFHDTDEEVGPAAHADIRTLRDAGFRVRVDVDAYGVVEATVTEYGESSVVQWMSESKRRFLPLIRDAEWGARLAPADLAVNKVLAASSRRKARDFVDLATIGERLCPLGPLIAAASGKPPHYSPARIVEQIRRGVLSMWEDEFLAVKGTPEGWSATRVREAVAGLLDGAVAYLGTMPVDVVGKLAISDDGVPVEVVDLSQERLQLRGPTEEPEVIPEFGDTASDWGVP